MVPLLMLSLLMSALLMFHMSVVSYVDVMSAFRRFLFPFSLTP